VNDPQAWTLIALVGTVAAGTLASITSLHQGVRASIGNLRQTMDGVDRRLDSLDRDVKGPDRPVLPGPA
jgi:hypothetical protein